MKDNSFRKELDYEFVFEKLVNKLDEYTTKNGLKSVVLGISGGIDSTVVAAIASEVSRRRFKRGEDFYLAGITMPASTTKSEEYEAAVDVMNAFCERCAGVELDRISTKFDGEILSIPGGMGRDISGNFSSPEKLALRRGNIKSRLRMIILYDAAKSGDGMVLGTDNMSEYMLGFSTIGGDGLFDYCPIQELWKTEVFGLAEYIADMLSKRGKVGDKRKSEAVRKSLALPPMDGLGISNTDMDQIGGKDYYEVDKVLKVIYERENLEDYPRLDDEPIVIDGVPEDTVNKIVTRYKSNKYKKNLPIYIHRDDLLLKHSDR